MANHGIIKCLYGGHKVSTNELTPMGKSVRVLEEGKEIYTNLYLCPRCSNPLIIRYEPKVPVVYGFLPNNHKDVVHQPRKNGHQHHSGVWYCSGDWKSLNKSLYKGALTGIRPIFQFPEEDLILKRDLKSSTSVEETHLDQPEYSDGKNTIDTTANQ